MRTDPKQQARALAAVFAAIAWTGYQIGRADGRVRGAIDAHLALVQWLTERDAPRSGGT